ncbi:MAG: hypothetical protein LQ352_004886 [Teloschistes flavicans]|nr:MAG: hypothetical protein LQ352_004886 [Teloschistes flavicans]
MRFLAIFRLAAPFLAFATTTSSRPLSGAAPGIDFTVYESRDCKGLSFVHKNMQYDDDFESAFPVTSYNLSKDLDDFDSLSLGGYTPTFDERKKGCHNARQKADWFTFTHGSTKVNDLNKPRSVPVGSPYYAETPGNPDTIPPVKEIPNHGCGG